MAMTKCKECGSRCGLTNNKPFERTRLKRLTLATLLLAAAFNAHAVCKQVPRTDQLHTVPAVTPSLPQ